jgi:hypothetical protein
VHLAKSMEWESRATATHVTDRGARRLSFSPLLQAGDPERPDKKKADDGVHASVHASDQRRRVLASLENAAEGLAIAEIMVEARLSSRNSANILLHKMAKAGEIERVKRGVYGRVGAIAEVAATNTGEKGKKEKSIIEVTETT